MLVNIYIHIGMWIEEGDDGGLALNFSLTNIMISTYLKLLGLREDA